VSFALGLKVGDLATRVFAAYMVTPGTIGLYLEMMGCVLWVIVHMHTALLVVESRAGHFMPTMMCKVLACCGRIFMREILMEDAIDFAHVVACVQLILPSIAGCS
jgi:hypothetical protein